MDIEQFSTIKKFAKKYPAFTEPSLRWMAFNRKANGFDRAFIKIGRKLLIDDAAFVECLRGKREGA